MRFAASAARPVGPPEDRWRVRQRDKTAAARAEPVALYCQQLRTMSLAARSLARRSGLKCALKERVAGTWADSSE